MLIGFSDPQADYKRKVREYKRCTAGKPADCSKCIGCKAKR